MLRYTLIGCEVLKRELEAAAADSGNDIKLEFLPKWLHDIGAEGMRQRLQAAIDKADVAADGAAAILLGYALCNNGAAGISARSLPLVIPRAHDCVTLFLGCRKRYHQYFHANPGVYFLTSGWMDYSANEELEAMSIQNRMGLSMNYQELVEKYGEDNAAYLLETLGDGVKNYSQYTFIEMGVEPDGSFERQGREMAAERNWRFEKIPGDMRLFNRLMAGGWDNSEFLVVPPGGVISQSYDDDIVKSKP